MTQLSAPEQVQAPGQLSIPGRRRRTLMAALPFVLLLLAVLTLVSLSVLIGAGEIGPDRVVALLRGQPDALADEHLKVVVNTIRIPRTIAALLVGTALGVAGTLMQAVTRNPLAETGLLGVNAGASLGVVAGLTYVSYTNSGFAYLLWAFMGALVASAIVLMIASAGRAAISPLRLLLAGAALGATFRGMTSFILVSDANVFNEYRFWVLGALTGITVERSLQILPAVIVGLVMAFFVARPLAALMLGDDVARALGHRPGLIRAVVSVAVTLLAASAVALSGPISFLGLIAPHVARAIAGPRLVRQVFLSALVGMTVLLTADVLGRVVIRPFEAPLNVLLALIGGPLLIFIARSPRMLTMRGAEGA